MTLREYNALRAKAILEHKEAPPNIETLVLRSMTKGVSMKLEEIVSNVSAMSTINTYDVRNSVSSVLKSLKDKQKVENVGRGFWRVAP
jgi:hypothetical protein